VSGAGAVCANAAAEAREEAARETAARAAKERADAELAAKQAKDARDRAAATDKTQLVADAKAAEDRLAKARKLTDEAEAQPGGDQVGRERLQIADKRIRQCNSGAGRRHADSIIS